MANVGVKGHENIGADYLRRHVKAKRIENDFSAALEEATAPDSTTTTTMRYLARARQASSMRTAGAGSRTRPSCSACAT